jgi:hypothetical protein
MGWADEMMLQVDPTTYNERKQPTGDVLCPACNGTGYVMVSTRKGKKRYGEIIRVPMPCVNCNKEADQR